MVCFATGKADPRLVGPTVTVLFLCKSSVQTKIKSRNDENLAGRRIVLVTSSQYRDEGKFSSEEDPLKVQWLLLTMLKRKQNETSTMPNKLIVRNNGDIIACVG